MAVEPTHWLLRVGDGTHFKSASKHNMWGFESTNKSNNRFNKEAKKGDLLWFVRTKGMLLGVATYVGHGKRILGPIIDISKTNEELGWIGRQDKDWKTDMEIHYENLYDLEYCELNAGIKGQTVIRRYKEDKCELHLPTEYENIVRYSRANKVR
jgi:hypothetical protein